jgi:hypothetical protein
MTRILLGICGFTLWGCALCAWLADDRVICILAASMGGKFLGESLHQY